MDEERRERIKIWMAACLIAVAFTADAAEFVLEWLGIGLAINMVTTPAYTLVFWIWFKMLDVPFIASPKKFFTLAATCLLEILPGLDAIFGFFWTAGTILLVIMIRAEDKGGILGTVSGAAMGLTAAKYSKYKGDFNRMGQLGRENQEILRRNMTISKKELVSEAASRNPRFKEGQYDRAIDQYGKTVGEAVQKLPPNTLDLKNKKGNNL